MRVALIYNRNQRTGRGERVQKVLEKYKKLEINQFDLKEIQNVRGGFDLYLRIDDGDYSCGIPFHLHPYVWQISDTHIKKCFKKIVKISKDCDYIFCCQKKGVEELSKIIKRQVFWLPHAVDEIPQDFYFR